MRTVAFTLVLLAACGEANSGATTSPASPSPNTATPAAPNPLIGVWARVSGKGCRADQYEFTATTITWQETGPGTPMRTAPVRYDLSDPHAPVATPAGGQPGSFRVIDPDHLAEGTDCVLARAD